MQTVARVREGPISRRRRQEVSFFSTRAGLPKAGPTARIVDISLLIESRDSESPPGYQSTKSTKSAKSTTSGATSSSGVTRPYTTAPTPYASATAHATAPQLQRPPTLAPQGYNGPMLMPLPVFSQQLPAEQVQGQAFRPFFTGPPSAAPALAYGSPAVAAPQGSNVNIKRSASQTPLVGESPAKKQSKWNKDDDVIITELRGSGMKWEDISKRFPGRSAMSCRLRYQNYIERRNEWDDEKKNKLARLYERFKKEMWEGIAKEMGVPWRTAEAMHWQLGELQMAERANVPLFQMAASTTNPLASAPPPATVNHQGLGYPLPQTQPMQLQAQPRPPAGRRNSAASGGRRRADSAKSGAPSSSTLAAVPEALASQRASTAPTPTSQIGPDDPTSASGPFPAKMKQERASRSPSQQYRPLRPAEATGTDTSEEEGRRQ